MIVRALPRLLLGAALCAGSLVVGVAPASAADRPGVVEIQTVPAVPGVKVSLGDHAARTDARGRVALSADSLEKVPQRIAVAPGVTDDKRVAVQRILSGGEHRIGVRQLNVGLQITRRVTVDFVDRAKRPVPDGRLSSLELRGSTGATIRVSHPKSGQQIWLAANHIGIGASGLFSRDVDYGVRSVVAEGGQLVYQGQQRIRPMTGTAVTVDLLFYEVRISSRDAIFGSPVGSGVKMTRPDGVSIDVPFDGSASALLKSLPRGAYQFRADAGGVTFSQPVTVSRDQAVVIRVISLLDILLVVGLGMAIALGLLLIGRPSVRSAVVLRFRSWRLRSWGEAATE